MHNNQSEHTTLNFSCIYSKKDRLVNTLLIPRDNICKGYPKTKKKNAWISFIVDVTGQLHNQKHWERINHFLKTYFFYFELS